MLALAEALLSVVVDGCSSGPCLLKAIAAKNAAAAASHAVRDGPFAEITTPAARRERPCFFAKNSTS